MHWNNGYQNEARYYLQEKRGLTLETCKEFKFGQLISTRWDSKLKKKVSLGNAISFPWVGPRGTIKAIQHRLIKHKQRFNQHAGGERTLFGTHLLVPSQERVLIVVEGEFNCSSIWQIAKKTHFPICSVSFGPEDNAKNVKPLIAKLAQYYFKTIVWADRMKIAKTIPADLHLATYNKQDANDLLVTGRLKDILERCLTCFS